MSYEEVEIEKFIGQNNYNLWRIKWKRVKKRRHLGTLIKGLEGKLNEDVLAILEEKVHSKIIIGLGNDVFVDIATKKQGSNALGGR